MSVLRQRLAPGERLLLDSSVLAAYLDGGEQVSPLAIELLDDLVRGGRNPAVVSVVSVMETLIRPLRTLPAAHATVLAFYRDFANLTVVPAGLDVAAEAANLRVAFGLAPPDALVAATGLAAEKDGTGLGFAAPRPGHGALDGQFLVFGPDDTGAFDEAEAAFKEIGHRTVLQGTGRFPPWPTDSPGASGTGPSGLPGN